jgi:hypothetical protein
MLKRTSVVFPHDLKMINRHFTMTATPHVTLLFYDIERKVQRDSRREAGKRREDRRKNRKKKEKIIIIIPIPPTYQNNW